MWSAQTPERFSQFTHRKSLKILNIRADPPQVTQMKTWRKFAKTLLKTGEGSTILGDC
jgi:hypothetical protein